MQEPYWWYVLFVKTNTEHKVVASFQKAYERKNMPYELKAFCPGSEKYYKDKSARALGRTYLRRPLFPSYVFVETNMPSEEFRTAMFDVIHNSSDIIKLLRNEGSSDIAISHSERVSLEYMLQGKRCLEHSIGYIEGDKIIITMGPLKDISATIKKINRHHRSAQIEVEFFGEKRTVDVALEIVERR